MSDSNALVNAATALGIAMDPDPGMLRMQVETKVRQLLLEDVNLLTSLLYRLDVDENEIARALAEAQDTDSASLLTDIIIQRQLRRIESRKQDHHFKQEDDIPEDEKW